MTKHSVQSRAHTQTHIHIYWDRDKFAVHIHCDKVAGKDLPPEENTAAWEHDAWPNRPP